MMKLTHLGQTHQLPFGYKASPEFIEKMVESQIKVANYIKSHPNALVFLEGLTENYSGIPDEMLSFTAKMIFPNGLPDNVVELNLLQKKFLYDFDGSVRVMNFLGELKNIYRTITPEQSAIVDFKISEGDYNHIFTTREKAAMDCIQEVVKENSAIKEVIVVYGDVHDFAQHCRAYGFEHTKFSCSNSKNMFGIKSPRRVEHQIIFNNASSPENEPEWKNIDSQSLFDKDKKSSDFKVGDKKMFKLTDTITLVAKYKKYEFGESGEPWFSISLRDNDIAVPNTTLLIQKKSSIDEVISNIENPRGLIECLKRKGHTANIIAEYISSHMN